MEYDKIIKHTKYKRHPNRLYLYVALDGSNIFYSDENHTYILRMYNKQTKKHSSSIQRLVKIESLNTTLSVTKIIAETLIPNKDNYFFTKQIDGDINNTNPNNIIWMSNVSENLNISIDNKIKLIFKASKLSIKNAIYCWKLNKELSLKTLNELSIEFNVSDMAIYRAIKNVEKYKLYNRY